MEVKTAFIAQVINNCAGNRTHSAIELDVPLRTLRYWVYEKYNLDIPYPKNAPNRNKKGKIK